MSFKVFRVIALALALGGVVVWGCGSPSDVHQDEQMEGGEGHAGDIPDEMLAEQAERIEAALAKLTPEDRASAEMQGVCPISDMKLGAMGTPIKFTLQGKEVWICCEDCEAELKADPDAAFAKLANLK